MIRLQNISYRSGSRTILEDVSLTVQPGEFLAIAGPNGAGKSSLLGVATGSIRQQQGGVAIGGRGIRDWTPAELAKRTAVLHQKSTLNLPFTVHDVVAMGRYPHAEKGGAAADVRIISEALEQCGILHLSEALYTNLSGGEQQRVHLARVFAQVWNPGDHRVRYLFLDEPGNNLDIRFQHESLQLARAFAAEGNCVLAVLHDLNLIMQYADSAVLMKAGRVIASGAVDAALTEESITEAFDYPVRFIHTGAGRPFILPQTGVNNHFTNKLTAIPS